MLTNNNENDKKIISRLFKYKNIDDKNRTLDLLETDLLYMANATKFDDIFEGQLIFNNETARNIILFRAILNELAPHISKKDYDKIINSKDPILNLKKWVYEDEDYVDNTFQEFSQKLDESIDKIINNVCNNFNQALKEQTLISSFSKENNNPHLWGVYSKNNTGICIEYNFYDIDNLYLADNCFEVEYLTEDEYEDSTEKLFQIPNVDMEYFIKFPFLRKKKEWEHQNEWRLVFSNIPYVNPYIKIINSDFFIKLPKPRKVILGKCIGVNKDKIVDICKKREIHVSEMELENINYVEKEVLPFPQGMYWLRRSFRRDRDLR